MARWSSTAWAWAMVKAVERSRIPSPLSRSWALKLEGAGGGLPVSPRAPVGKSARAERTTGNWRSWLAVQGPGSRQANSIWMLVPPRKSNPARSGARI